MIPVMCLLVMASVEPPKEDAKQELDKLQGRWAGVSSTINGKKENFDPDKPGGHFELRGQILGLGFDDRFEPLGRIEVDPTKQPKTMDALLGPWGPQQKKELCKAIYKLDGNTLTVAYLRIEHADGQDADLSEQRPTGFETEPVDSTKKPHLRVLVLKRVKSEKK